MKTTFQPLISMSMVSIIIFSILAALGVVLVIYLIRRSTDKIAKNNDQTTKKQSIALQKTKQKFQNVFARYGYLPKDDLSRSFVNALETMKYFVGGKHYRYRLPWFLVIGAQQSGKTTLLRSLHMDLPVGSPHVPPAGSIPACEWRFYDNGILLDLRGDLVLRKDEISSQEENWNLLLSLLVNHRSNRPLDGIVLTISCEELIHATSIEDLIGRADYLYLKLWKAQRILGIRVPVYVVITKCDRIAGFSSFCNEIPPESQEDIFGWSVPYSPDVLFQGHWLDELFGEMNEQLLRIQQEIFAQGQIYNERDGIFVFPYEFQKIKTPLSLYLKHLFKESSYHESFFLRGVYFSGDAAFGTHAFPDAEESLQSKLDEAYTEKSTLLEQDTFSQELVPLVDFPPIYFSTKLFREKIFREQGLARPTRHYFLANAKSLRLAQIAGATLTLYGTFGLFQAYDVLQESRNNVLPNLNKIHSVVQRSLADKDRVATDKVFFEQQAQLILNTLTDIRLNEFFSIFIPFSWISSLEPKIQQLLTMSYDKIILVALSQKLYAQVGLLIDEKLGSSVDASSVSLETGKINPLSTSEFRNVKEYIDRLYDFQIIGLKLNNLPDSNSINDLAFVVRKIFGYELPQEFYLNTDIYIKALAKTTLEPFRFNVFMKAATERLKNLYNTFLRAAFNPEKLSPDLSVLVHALKRFSDGGQSYDINQLHDLTQKISKVITLLNSPTVAWLARDSFDPGKEFEDFIGKIASCYFVGQSTTDTLIRESNLAFNQFKIILSAYRSPFVGTLFKVEKNAGSFTSESLLKMQGLLNLLFSEPFMATVNVQPIQTGIPGGTFPLWNYQTLDDAKKLLLSHKKFVNNKLNLFPEAMWEVLRLISLKGLRDNIQTTISKAQNFVPHGRDIVAFSPEDAFLPEVQNLRIVIAPLSSLLTGLKAAGAIQVYSNLKKVLANQCLDLLRKIDFIMESENPYGARQDVMCQWDGEEKLSAFSLFGLYNETELKEYMETQRERIRYLAKEFAEPAIQLLQQIVGIETTALPVVYAKWNSILNQLNLHSRGIAGNSLAILQDFILVDLNKTTFQNCTDMNTEDGSGNNPTDFFLQKRNAIRRALTARCQGVVQDVSRRDYTEIASYFNTYLAGRFPFDSGTQKNVIEASLDHVQKFYQLFDEKEEGARQLITESTVSPTVSAEAAKFLDSIAQLRPFFQPLMDQGDGQDPQALPFSLTFRTNQDREVNGNQIIGWQMKIGDMVYDAHQPTLQGKWVFGLPIEVQLRWALGSPIRPVASKNAGDVVVTPLTVTFNYGGTWSLLRLLKNQKASPMDFPAEGDPEPQTLKFDIPCTINKENCARCGEEPTPNPYLAKNNKTIVFMSLKLLQSDGDSSEPLDFPYFPKRAPVLPSSVESGLETSEEEEAAEENPEENTEDNSEENTDESTEEQESGNE